MHYAPADAGYKLIVIAPYVGIGLPGYLTGIMNWSRRSNNELILIPVCRTISELRGPELNTAKSECRHHLYHLPTFP